MTNCFFCGDIWIRSRAQEQHNCVREKTGLANSSPALSGRGAREYLTIIDNTWLYLTILGRGARVTLFPGLTLFLEPFAPQPAALSPLFLVTSCPLLLSFILPALWLLAFVFFSSLCLLRVVGPLCPRYVNTWQRKGESNQMRWSLPAILDITDNTWQYLMTILDMTILDNTWKYLERKGVDNERAFRWGDQTDQISAGDLPRRVIV